MMMMIAMYRILLQELVFRFDVVSLVMYTYADYHAHITCIMTVTGTSES